MKRSTVKKFLAYTLTLVVLSSAAFATMLAGGFKKAPHAEEESIYGYAAPVRVESIDGFTPVKTAADFFVAVQKNSNILLMNDISFEQNISNDNNAIIDGNGYAVSLYGLGGFRTGFIKRNNGTIRNLIVKNVNFSLGSDVCGGVAAVNNGTISNCALQGGIPFNTAASMPDTAIKAGGIAGENNGIIEYVSMDDSGIYTYTPLRCRVVYLGGIAGENNGIIRYSSFSNSASATYKGINVDCGTGGAYVGGIAGLCGGSSKIHDVEVGTTQKSDGQGINVILNLSSVNNVNIGGIAGSASGSITGVRLRSLSEINVTGRFYLYGGTEPQYVNIGGFIGSANGSFSDMTSTGEGTVITASVQQSSYVSMFIGGFAGQVNATGAVNACYTNMSVDADEAYIGGFVGRNWGSITESAAVSDINLAGEGVYTVGGVAAYNAGGRLSRCYFQGAITLNNVEGQMIRVGGIVGVNNMASIADSLALCSLTVSESGGENSYAGGIAGSNSLSSIVNSVYIDRGNSSVNAGTPNRGGVTGDSSGTITGCYYSSDVFSTSAGGAEAVKVAGNAVHLMASFPKLDFLNTWGMSGNYATEQRYPVPRNMPFDGGGTDFYEAVSLSGSMVCDAQGIIYTLDEDNKTAVVTGVTDEVKNSTDPVTLEVRSSVLYNGGIYKLDSIGDNAFDGFTYLYDIILAPAIENIGKAAFRRCVNIEQLRLPVQLKTIGEYAFDNCTKLKSISIPIEVSRLSDNLFYNCTGLRNVTVGRGVKTVGNEVFAGCDNLLNVTFWGDRPKVGSGMLTANTNRCIIRYNSAAEGWAELNGYNNGSGWKIKYGEGSDYRLLPYGEVTVLDEYAVGDNVRGMDDQGIVYRINGSVAYVGAADGTSGINTNTSKYEGFNDGRIYIPKQVVFPNSVSYSVAGISSFAFTGSALTDIALPETITNINSDAFNGASALRTVTYKGPQPVNDTAHIGPRLYNNTPADMSVIILAKNGGDWMNWTTMSSRTLYKVTELDFNGKSLHTVGQGISYDVNNDTYTATVGSARGGDNRTNSSGYTGANDGAVVLPEYVFKDNNAYRVTAIDRYAFFNNGYVKSIDIGKSVTQIGDAAFRQCQNLTAFTVNAANPAYEAIDGVLFGQFRVNSENSSDYFQQYGLSFSSEEGAAPQDVIVNKLIKVPENISLTNNHYDIPKTVTIIDNYAFAGNRNIKTINLVPGVTETGAQVEIIGDSAFESAKFTSLTLPDTVTRIGKNAFFNCAEARAVNIPAATAYIGDGAFRSCPAIENFTVSAGNAKYYANSGVLYERHVGPDGAYITEYTMLQYPAANARTEFDVASNVTEIATRAFDNSKHLMRLSAGDSVAHIGYMAFSNCNNLRSVTIGKSLQYIDGYIFFGCTSLLQIIVDKQNEHYMADDNGVMFDKSGSWLIVYPAGNQRLSYTVPDTVTDIEPFAFAGNRALKRVILPESINYVGDSAFAECNRLDNAYFKGDAPAHFGKYVFSAVADGFVINYRKDAAGWSSNYNGYTAEIYNAIKEVPSDSIVPNTYAFVVVNTYGEPIENIRVNVNGMYKTTDARGIATYEVYDWDTVRLVIDDPTGQYYTFTNEEFALDKMFMLSYFTVAEKSRVSGITAQGLDINSQTASINLSKDNVDSNGKWIHEYVSITIDGYFAKGLTVVKYSFIQDGDVIAYNTNKGDGFLKGQFTFPDIKHSTFKEEIPIVVMMELSEPDYEGNQILYTTLNLHVYRFDKPNVSNINDTMNKNAVNVRVDKDMPLLGGLKFAFGGGSDQFNWVVTEDTIKLGMSIDVKPEDDKNDMDKKLDEHLSNEKKNGNDSKEVEKNGEADFNLKVAGFIIFKYNKSGVRMEYCEIRGTMSFSYSYEKQIWVMGVIPVYLTAEFGLDASMTLILKYDDSVNKIKLEQGLINVQGKLDVFAGVGIKNANIGLYGKAVLTVIVELPSPGLKLISVYGEIGLRYSVSFLFFSISGSKQFVSGTWTIYAAKQGSTMTAAIGLKTELTNMLVPENYSLVASPYLNNSASGSEALGFQTVEDADGNQIRVYLEDANSVDGKTAQYDEYNYQKLVYKVFDGTDWTEAALVEDNGYTDQDYSIYRHGDDIYLVYSQSDDVFDETADMDSFAATLNIRVAKWDAAAGRFKDFTALNSGASLDMQPKLTVAGGKLTAAWVKNADNNMFGTKERRDENGELVYDVDGNVIFDPVASNAVWFSQLTGTTWSTPVRAANGLGTVTSLEPSGDGIAAVIDKDGNLSEADDRLIYKFAYAAYNNTLASYLAVPKAGAYLEVSNIDGELVYVLDGNLYKLAGHSALFGKPLTGFAGGHQTVMKDGDPYALVYPVSTTGEDAAELGLYAVFYGNGTWGMPILIQPFEESAYVKNFTAFLNGGGGLELFCMKEIFSEDGTGFLFEHKAVELPKELILGAVTFEYNDLLSALQNKTYIELAAELTNRSAYSLTSVTVTVMNPSGSTAVYDKPAGINAASGAVADLRIDDLFLANPEKGRYTMTVSSEIGGETVTSNTMSFTLVFSDLTVVSKQVVLGEQNQLLVMVKNTGYLASGGTLYVMRDIYSGKDENGNVLNPGDNALYSYSVPQLATGEYRYYVIELDTEFYEGVKAGIVTLFVESANDEYMAYNNYAYVSVSEVNGIKYESEPTVYSSSIYADVRIFDKAEPQNITVGITENGNTFAGIFAGTTELSAGDYMRNDDTVGILPSYLNTLAAGTHELEFRFDTTEGTQSRYLTITVIARVKTVTWVVDGVSTVEYYDYSDNTYVYKGNANFDDTEFFDPYLLPDDINEYEFREWILSGTGDDVIMTAAFNATPRKYTVSFNAGYGKFNDNSTEKSVVGNYGDPVNFTQEPSREDTEYYAWDFIGWDKVIEPITGSVTYVAQYTPVSLYTYTFYGADGQILKSEKLREGLEIDAPLSDPAKTGTADCNYYFDGWDTAIPAEGITGDINFRPTFRQVNLYTYTFLNDDGSVLKQQKVEEGSAIEAPETNPVKAGTANYSYTFTGWDKEIPAGGIGSSIIFYPTFKSAALYTYTFLDDDGSVLKTENAEEGTTIAAPDLPPREGYTAAWDREFSELTGDITVKAVYTEISSSDTGGKKGCRKASASITALLTLTAAALLMLKRRK